MLITHITTKGQVTIPKFFRDKYGLLPNTDVEFVEKNGKLILEKPKPGRKRKNGKLSRGAQMVRRMTGKGTWPKGMSTDELIALMRGDDLDA